MQIFKQHRAFFVLYFVFLLISAYVMVVYSKSSIHIYFNQFHNIFSDTFFKYLTHLGDGITVVLIGLAFLLFNSKRAGLLIWLTGILNGLISQGMKHWIFGEAPRPYKYFTEVYPTVLHYVEGVDLNSLNSLPSGHTSASFALYLSIAMIYQNRRVDNIMFLMAFGIGISRIYLSQHFLEDVFMGSIIGVLSAIVIYSWLYSPDQLEKPNLSSPLIKKLF